MDAVAEVVEAGVLLLEDRFAFWGGVEANGIICDVGVERAESVFFFLEVLFLLAALEVVTFFAVLLDGVKAEAILEEPGLALDFILEFKFEFSSMGSIFVSSGIWLVEVSMLRTSEASKFSRVSIMFKSPSKSKFRWLLLLCSIERDRSS